MREQQFAEWREHITAGAFLAALGGTLLSVMARFAPWWSRESRLRSLLALAQVCDHVALAFALACIVLAVCRRPPAREVIIMSAVLAAGNGAALAVVAHRIAHPYEHVCALLFTFAASLYALIRFGTGPSAGTRWEPP